jgi:LacI family transcriptional regulator
MPKVRIQDVAEHAGVSLMTITRVINNSGYVAPETRERVQEAIKTLGYIPNHMAKALKSSKTGIIGNVLPLITINQVFARISQSLKDAALPYGFKILPVYTEDDPERDEQMLHELIGRMVEGIIFTGVVRVRREVMLNVISKKIPIVMIERPMNVKGVDKLVWDNTGGSLIAASHFIERGHRNLGFIGKQFGKERYEKSEKDRFEGFRRGLLDAGVVLEERNIRLTEKYEVECGYQAMKQIMEQSEKEWPSGVYTASDILLCGILQYLYEKGLNVPRDISIISHDNTLAGMCSPPITSVAIPFEEMGRTALSLFWERREGRRLSDKSIVLNPFLVDRGSVRSVNF